MSRLTHGSAERHRVRPRIRLGPVRALAWASTLLLGTAPAATAQTVTATVLDDDSDRPVHGATAVLVAESGAAVDSAVTDPDGRAALDAPGPGRYYLSVFPPGYLSMTEVVDVADGPVGLVIRMPLRSTAAAALMRTTMDREAALQLPLEELCREPLRPWEAGVLLGVVRDRATMEPREGALVRLVRAKAADAPEGAAAPADPARVAGGAVDAWSARRTPPSGVFWFCNVPAGNVRVVATADGFRPDTFTATVRAGAVAWYDALLRSPRKEDH